MDEQQYDCDYDPHPEYGTEFTSELNMILYEDLVFESWTDDSNYLLHFKISNFFFAIKLSFNSLATGLADNIRYLIR